MKTWWQQVYYFFGGNETKLFYLNYFNLNLKEKNSSWKNWATPTRMKVHKHRWHNTVSEELYVEEAQGGTGNFETVFPRWQLPPTHLWSPLDKNISPHWLFCNTGSWCQTRKASKCFLLLCFLLLFGNLLSFLKVQKLQPFQQIPLKTLIYHAHCWQVPWFKDQT